MIRLGILGVESTHTGTFIKEIAENPETTLVAIAPENINFLDDFVAGNPDLDCVYCKPEELGDYCDAIIVTTRDGGGRLEFIKKAARYGMPMWIDKPFTASVEDAVELIKFLSENSIPYSGGTSVKYASTVQGMKKFCLEHREKLMSALLTYRIYLNSPYSGMHFYAPHVVESAVEALGIGARSVASRRSGDNLACVVEYDGFVAMLNFAADITPFNFGAFAADGNYMAGHTPEHGVEGELIMFGEFLDMIKNGKMPRPPEFYLEAVKLSCAIEKSMKEGRVVPLKEV